MEVADSMRRTSYPSLNLYELVLCPSLDANRGPLIIDHSRARDLLPGNPVFEGLGSSDTLVARSIPQKTSSLRGTCRTTSAGGTAQNGLLVEYI